MREELKYPTFDDQELDIHVYYDENLDRSKTYPLVVFYFGGGWSHGSLEQFSVQAQEFANHGYIAACVEYRILQKHGTTIDFAMKDAFYSIKYLSDNKERFCIDKDQVFVSGGSAGGHLALCCIVLNGVPHDFKFVGVISFNGAFDVTHHVANTEPVFSTPFHTVVYSPMQHLSAGLPPTIAFWGIEDQGIPYAKAQNFAKVYQSYGNEYELIGYEGRAHGFFNQSPDKEDTLAKAIAFADRIVTVQPSAECTKTAPAKI